MRTIELDGNKESQHSKSFKILPTEIASRPTIENINHESLSGNTSKFQTPNSQINFKKLNGVKTEGMHTPKYEKSRISDSNKRSAEKKHQVSLLGAKAFQQHRTDLQGEIRLK